MYVYSEVYIFLFVLLFVSRSDEKKGGANDPTLHASLLTEKGVCSHLNDGD